jgi:putative glutamine amidotransferase
MAPDHRVESNGMSRTPTPLILVTCWGQSSVPAQGPWSAVSGAPPAPARRETVPADYVWSVMRAGASPLLLPNTAEEAPIAAAVEAAGALVLTGGGDVLPSLYGQEAHGATCGVDPARDVTEELAIELAMKRGLPILAICRGIQVLNVALGGTLIQDIPTQHAAPEGCPPVVHSGRDHEVRVEPGSLLHKMWGREAATVNSTHHQAVDRLAAGLRPIAWAPDGIIEAVELIAGDSVLAVQFHPEKLAAREEGMLKLFRWVVDRAAKKTMRE